MMLFKCINITFPMPAAWAPVLIGGNKPTGLRTEGPCIIHVTLVHPNVCPLLYASTKLRTVDSKVNGSPCPPPHLAPGPVGEDQQVVSQSGHS